MQVWITGGGSGIGRALAEQLTLDGHSVCISGRSKEKLSAVSPDISAIPCDVSKPESVQNALIQMPPPDLAILNAGTYSPGPTHTASPEEFQQAMAVNYFGVINCLTALLPRMLERGGHIAVVGSLAGYRGLPNASGYGPSKAAVISLCESMRAELDGTGVKFQLINPGFVKSPLTEKNDFEMPYLMEAEEAADIILRGLQSNRFEIAFPAPFVRRLKFIRLLPYRFFFPLIQKVTRT